MYREVRGTVREGLQNKSPLQQVTNKFELKSVCDS
jgi:hypothetical protein